MLGCLKVRRDRRRAEFDHRVCRGGGYQPLRSPGPVPESFFYIQRRMVEMNRRREERIYRLRGESVGRGSSRESWY